VERVSGHGQELGSPQRMRCEGWSGIGSDIADMNVKRSGGRA